MCKGQHLTFLYIQQDPNKRKVHQRRSITKWPVFLQQQ